MPPPEKRMRATSHRLIPPEIVEKILTNLPVKSLLRFSSVSRSWNSTISDSAFVKRYRGRGRQRIVLVRGGGFSGRASCLVSSISSSHPSVKEASHFVCPFKSALETGNYHIPASCDDMWLALAGQKLFLWNPSMRTYKEVPKRPFMWIRKDIAKKDFVIGLGYEPVEDDYKILKIPRPGKTGSAELYSLRRDTWRNIKEFPKNIHDYRSLCTFVSGNLHWLCRVVVEGSSDLFPSIMSFDLLTKKFGEVGLSPIVCRVSYSGCKISGLSSLRGMLSVSVDCVESCEIWVMEEYGVVESWTKKFTIDYFNSIPGFVLEYIWPLYLYENGEILVGVGDRINKWGGVFVYKDEESTPKEVGISCSCDHSYVEHGNLYIDSLGAPSMWSRR